MWLRVAVISRGPVLIMFKIDSKFNLGNNYRICNDDNTLTLNHASKTFWFQFIFSLTILSTILCR
jgi:hypothetical protein